MQALNARRGRYKGTLTRLEKYAEEIGTETLTEAIEVRLEKIEDIYKEFSELQLEYDALIEEEDYEDQSSEIEDFEKKYFDTKTKLARCILNRKGPVTSSPTVNAHSLEPDASIQILNMLAQQQTTFFEQLKTTQEQLGAKLPVLKIPFFGGDYKEWISFRDLFKSLVHDNINLKNSQKFQYLKGFLREEAAGLIKHMQISESGYEEAWQKLCERYEKSHQIIKSFIESFLSLPTLHSASAVGLRKMTDSADQVLRGLRTLSEYAQSRDPWLIQIVLQKTDDDTKQNWAEEQLKIKNPTWKNFYEFLEKRCFALEGCENNNRKISTFNYKKPVQAKNFSTTVSDDKCPKCNEKHYLYQCPQFISMNTISRRALVKNKRLCFNCLKPSHSANSCTSKSRCKQCHTQHHTLVHPSTKSFVSTNNKNSDFSDSVKLDTSPETSSSQNEPESSFVNFHSSPSQIHSPNMSVLLPTANAKVKDVDGNIQNIRLLLDSGSQISFITEACAQRLGLPRKNAIIEISGLSSSGAGVTRGKVNLTLYSSYNNGEIALEAFILPKITSNLPNTTFDISKLEYVAQLNLADPDFNISKPIDILIGVDKFFEILQSGRIQVKPGEPIAQLTIFGWIVAGEINYSKAHDTSMHSFHTCIDIDKSLKRFWELEEISHNKNLLTEDEKQAETHFQKTFSRSLDGKYIVALPFKDKVLNFDNSIANAAIRLKGMERRFTQNPVLRSSYNEFLNEYLNLGHMEKVPKHEINTNNCYYLPHHAVFKPASTTSKIRVVFDGSSKPKGGNSLNEKLLPGPCILKDLFAICLRFRRHKYAFSADIEKMFRQIWVAETDRDYQRIVWRDSVDKETQHFRLSTVTYGTTSAPFHANRVLKQLAIDHEHEYPSAAKIVSSDFYMDDVMSGGDTVENVLKIKDELINLLKSGGFHLRKWISNCWPLMQSLPEDMREFSPINFDDSTENFKVLGLRWHPSTDEFTYTVNFSDDVKITKRKILSDASKLFDPLGFLAPSIILAKSLLQLLWLQKLDWDDEVSAIIRDKWLNLKNDFSCVDQLKISRFIGTNSDNIEFHGFCDASEIAYSAVIYCRYTNEEKVFQTSIIAAKSKVAPIKQVSIPRLELCGALLLTKLVKKIVDSLEVKTYSLTAWTDSNIVLNWLSAHPRRWKTFVANRVAEILEVIPRNNWRHIQSEFNPADCASRGILPSVLITSKLWFDGPVWLSQPYTEWPKGATIIDNNDIKVIDAEKKDKFAEVFNANIENLTLTTLVQNCSKWTMIIRIIAWCLRFAFNSKSRIKTQGALKTFELSRAKCIIIRWSQELLFANEIKNLKLKKQILPSSKIINLSPFLDKDGILRVGGRISNSALPNSVCHPIILSKDNAITSLLIQHFHIKYLHAGVAHLFSLVRQEFWVLGSRNLIRKIVHQCIQCFKQRHTTMTQLMSNLPPSRVQIDHPFMKTGVDYAGPITLRSARGRNPKFTKAYIAIFVCFVTKALHIELVNDLTSEAFLCALKRFTSRRGKCSDIFSDNGTTFQGAHRKLNEMLALVTSKNYNSHIENSLANDGIRWHFIPPASPNMGGLWEAGVKSIKLHLKRVIGNQVLTFNEMYTILTEIEAILNSRPICVCSDLETNYLTPAHFLIGRTYTAIPEPDTTNINPSRLTTWQLLKNMVRGFWKKWQSDYLTSLQQRPKWQSVQPNVKEGQLVILKDNNSPPAKWRLAIIKKCHPGSDNCVRVVTITTKDGDFVRPITKIAVLPTS